MPNRQINVYSPVVVVAPGETFSWVLNSAEANQVAVSSQESWPLTPAATTVIAGTPTSVTIASTATPVSYSFSCDPPAPNVEEQELVVAAVGLIGPCSQITLAPGEYFIWINDTDEDVTIEPDPSNTDYWPFPGNRHMIGKHGHLALQIPPDAETGKTYNLVVTYEGGGGCTQATQPKIIVQGSGV